MSMTIKNPTKYPAPHPVTPWFARLFRRRPTPAQTARRALASADPASALVAGMRQADDLRAAREEVARWKEHADSYARERDDALREGAQLLAWIAALHPASAVIAPAHDVEESQDLYLVAGGWQLCWPVRYEDADLFGHVTAVDVTDVRAQWDGHGSEQRGQRLRNHVRLLALDTLAADGVLTPVTDASPTAVQGRQGGSEVRSA
ncbi:hypothetical protein [Streptomyces tagetis]|uniref:Uncharacterized protein n=1 Tax=Streptomyces tagetis TaxID=2820809 RepID=A0A941B2Y4_9ACTN|nr:hypothetical protein [Streptomyces sp. RG38]MBQ0827667.1 hypothetical protein [Streptomyces sp. RG38]